MRNFLLAAGTVHAMALGCDYLTDRLDGKDEVIVVSTTEQGVDRPSRDADDATNVAQVRLPGAIETVESDGDPVTAIRETVQEHDLDEIVVAPTDPVTAESVASLGLDLGRPIVLLPGG